MIFYYRNFEAYVNDPSFPKLEESDKWRISSVKLSDSVVVMLYGKEDFYSHGVVNIFTGDQVTTDLLNVEIAKEIVLNSQLPVTVKDVYKVEQNGHTWTIEVAADRIKVHVRSQKPFTDVKLPSWVKQD